MVDSLDDFMKINALENKIADLEEEVRRRLREELSTFRKSEKELSDAYLRIRELVGAWDTKPGGEDRFEVTEAAVKRLKEENERLRAKSIRNDSYMSEILNSGDGVYRP